MNGGSDGVDMRPGSIRAPSLESRPRSYRCRASISLRAVREGWEAPARCDLRDRSGHSMQAVCHI